MKQGWVHMHFVSKLRTCFWNPCEHRLRAGWRLLMQLILNLGGAAVFTALVVPHTPLKHWPRLAVEALGYPMLFGITLLSIWFAARFLDKRAWSDLGLMLRQSAWWLDFGAGFLVGFVLIVLMMASAAALGLMRLELSFTSGISGLTFPAAALLAALGYAAVGLFEETARAYHMRNLFEGLSGTRLGLWGAAALVSVAMHSGMAVFVLYVFVSMTIQGLFYFLIRRIGLIVGYHIAWDLSLDTVFGIEALSMPEHTGLFTPHWLDVVQVSAAGIQIADWPRLCARRSNRTCFTCLSQAMHSFCRTMTRTA